LWANAGYRAAVDHRLEAQETPSHLARHSISFGARPGPPEPWADQADLPDPAARDTTPAATSTAEDARSAKA
jgi:hypothetical protein